MIGLISVQSVMFVLFTLLTLAEFCYMNSATCFKVDNGGANTRHTGVGVRLQTL